MTAAASSDGDRLDYTDIALAVRDLALAPKEELAELYARVVLSVALGNTDDHLRNHGFLSHRGFWQLSPAFDVNPTPDLYRTRSTSIAGADRFPDETEALLAFAEECSLSLEDARADIGRLVTSLADWQSTARHNGVSAAEIRLMAGSINPRLEALSAI